METLAAFLLTFLVSLGMVLWQSLVFALLWNWFIASLFHAPTLNILQAFGVGLVVSLLTSYYRHDAEKYAGRTLAYGITYPAVALVIGFALHLILS